MTKESYDQARSKRVKIQARFWSQVGTAEHINIPKLEDAVRREFCTADDRLVRAQVRLMQTEGRVRVEDKVKVWINQPEVV
jgi:hypothetical protein